jgi:hypothetical protein
MLASSNNAVGTTIFNDPKFNGPNLATVGTKGKIMEKH